MSIPPFLDTHITFEHTSAQPKILGIGWCSIESTLDRDIHVPRTIWCFFQFVLPLEDILLQNQEFKSPSHTLDTNILIAVLSWRLFLFLVIKI